MELRGNHKLILSSILISSAFILNIIDRSLFSFTPMIRVGLANIPVIISIEILGFKNSFIIVIFKIMLNSMLYAGINLVIAGLAASGGFLSFFTMWILRKKMNFSIIPVSMWGGMSSTFAQVTFLTFVLNTEFFSLFKSLIIFGIINGILTGIASFFVLKQLHKL